MHTGRGLFKENLRSTCRTLNSKIRMHMVVLVEKKGMKFHVSGDQNKDEHQNPNSQDCLER